MERIRNRATPRGIGWLHRPPRRAWKYRASKRRHVPDELGVEQLALQLSSPRGVVVGSPEPLHVLLRHRLRSISREGRPKPPLRAPAGVLGLVVLVRARAVGVVVIRRARVAVRMEMPRATSFVGSSESECGARRDSRKRKRACQGDRCDLPSHLAHTHLPCMARRVGCKQPRRARVAPRLRTSPYLS